MKGLRFWQRSQPMDEEINIEVIAEEPIILKPRSLPFVDEIPRRIIQVGEFWRGQPLIFVNERALRLMESHTRSTLKFEVGGLVFGDFYQHGDVPFIYIEAAIPASQAQSGSGSLFFTPQAIIEIEEQRQANYPHLRSVGWYHSHPGFGIFMSPTDTHSHRTVFSNGPFVAFVLDPVARTDGVFAWINSKVAGPLAYWVASI
jgi:proteasome lid subunit RPN8/RPN11